MQPYWQQQNTRGGSAGRIFTSSAKLKKVFFWTSFGKYIIILWIYGYYKETVLLFTTPPLGTADCWQPRAQRFSLKPEVGQKTAMHASPTARDFFLELISTLPIHSPAFFPQNFSRVFPVLAVANTGFCVGLQNKIGHSAGCRLQNICYCFSGFAVSNCG